MFNFGLNEVEPRIQKKKHALTGAARSDEIREGLAIANLNRAVLDRNDSRTFPVLKVPIDVLPGRADQFSKHPLRNLEPGT